MAITSGISNLGLKPGVCTSSSRPTNPYEGMMIYETDTNRVLVYDNSAWVMIADTDYPPGLVLIKTQSVSTSGVNSVTLTNVFSSEFDSYRLIYSGGTSLSNFDLVARLGPSSVSGYNTGYYSTLFYMNGNPGSFTTAQNANSSEMPWVGGGSSGSIYAVFDILSPYVATWTRIHSGSYQNNLNVGFQTGEHRSNGQFTDITVFGGGSSTMTGGTIRVYGYRNSI